MNHTIIYIEGAFVRTDQIAAIAALATGPDTCTVNIILMNGETITVGPYNDERGAAVAQAAVNDWMGACNTEPPAEP